jgi:uncharacterized membrane protein affecting hemolysin expression
VVPCVDDLRKDSYRQNPVLYRQDMFVVVVLDLWWMDRYHQKQVLNQLDKL